MTPNKEHIRLWVEALRSGKYRKTKDALRKGNAFCCLGVACDVSGVAGWEEEGWDGRERYGECSSELPTSVQRWLGIGDADPVLLTTRDDTEYCASELNDGDGPTNYGFKRIADLIEAKYLKAHGRHPENIP